MSGIVKKRTSHQKLELQNLVETSHSVSTQPSTSDGTVQQQNSDTGCLALCHLGHQVVPLDPQVSNAGARERRQDKRTRPKRMRANKDAAALKAELVGPAARYLHTHLDFIYYACMVPYKRESMLECQEMSASKKRWMLVMHYLQKIGFWLMMTLASLNGGLYSKTEFMRFLGSRKPIDFVDFGNSIAVFVIGIFWIILWTNWTDRVGYTLESIETYEERIVETNAQKNGGMRQNSESAFKWVLLFEIVSWTAALFKSVFLEGFSDWNLEDFVLESSEYTSRKLFDWTVNKNGTEYWYLNYGEQLNATTVSLGCFGILMRLAGKLLMITIRDTFLVLTYTVFVNLSRFMSRIVDFANLPIEEVRDEDCQEMEEHWMTYLIARDMIKDINWAFGSLVKLLHVGNELFLAYFMQNCLDDTTPGMTLVLMFFSMSKFLCAYGLAANIHQYNTSCENWIMNWSRRRGVIQIDNEMNNVSSILKQLKREPLAIGDGNFVVNQLFVVKFICFGVSLVMFYITQA